MLSAVRGDIGTRKQDRVVRLDLSQQGRVAQASIAELERQLTEAFRVTFAARQAAYDDEVFPVLLKAVLQNKAFCRSTAN